MIKLRCLLRRYFAALLALVTAILCILHHRQRDTTMPPPSNPPAITGSYSSGTPTSPPAVTPGYAAGTPSAPPEVAEDYLGGTDVLVLDYQDAIDDMPSGRFVPLGTSSSLGAAWVYENDAGSVALTEGGELTGGGTVWVQRDGGLFSWSMEHSNDWATESPTVYLQQTAGDASRATTPTPADVDPGGWLDVINDVDPEADSDFSLELDRPASPPACTSSYTPGTPSAPPAIS